MKITRREFLTLAGGTAAGFMLGGCGSAPKKHETLEKAVEKTPETAEKPVKPAVEKTPEEKWMDYIEQVRKEMPAAFVGAEQIEYKGKIHAVLFNGSEDAKYLNELERVYNSLKRLGVTEDNIAVLCDTDDLPETKKKAGAIGAKQGTKETLKDILGKLVQDCKEEDILICYFTGNHKNLVEMTENEDPIWSHVLVEYMGGFKRPKTLKELKSKVIMFFGHPSCEIYGNDFKNIPDLISVNAANRRPTVLDNYSFLSTVAEVVARGASVEQAVDYARKEQKKIFEYGQELGLIGRTDEGAFVSRVELDLSKRLPRGSPEGAYAKVTEIPDLMTKRVKRVKK